MFHRSTLLAVLREVVLRFTSVEVALKPIQRLLADRPDPDAAAVGPPARPEPAAPRARRR